MWSKSGPTHALDDLVSRACDQLSFMCANKATGKKLWNTIWEWGYSQFFFMLASLFLQARPNQHQSSADCFQYLIRAGVGWVSLARLPCSHASVVWHSCCLGHGLFVWQACTAFMPLRLLVNHSASFQAVWLPLTSFQTVQPGFQMGPLCFV